MAYTVSKGLAYIITLYTITSLEISKNKIVRCSLPIPCNDGSYFTLNTELSGKSMKGSLYIISLNNIRWIC